MLFDINYTEYTINAYVRSVMKFIIIAVVFLVGCGLIISWLMLVTRALVGGYLF